MPPSTHHLNTTAGHHSPPHPTLTTTLYHTHFGTFALTWSRSLLRRSLHLHLLPTTTTAAAAAVVFHLNPLIFWTKYGSKKIPIRNSQNEFIHIHYDLSRAKFGSGPEPVSGFFIAAIIAGETALLVGDFPKKPKFRPPENTHITVLRREHVHGAAGKKYTTKATFRGKTREISVDCTQTGSDDDCRLIFSVDGKRVLLVKHLNWKFRGNERVEIEGVQIQISWDVYNWLFKDERDDRHALFMFRFEKSGFDYHEDDKYLTRLNGSGSGLLGSGSVGSSLGVFGIGNERRKGKKGMSRARSLSSSSLSSVSSGCGSVMEWESVEENELKGPSGFTLLVYAWRG